ncbi:ABC transporter ATP-binding protein [Sphingomonas naphthae]|uniref:ABC transporter ATP-binding protein n=1 Tax=Sphingomonas naphthae TaxID=1813468 RepID=A0ABY7TNN4_9SPHN|nr:ABC transporter ATP-binding protein [Sphingomonas naphthae]WCT74852.1 ABC transporter ATP-binding protein [Sphingomonas naphthae]
MILFENVSKSYEIHKFQKQVLNNLSFQINRGESIGICGANGAGKSTLMRLLAGIEAPTSGKVTRGLKTSWPMGYGSAFVGAMTGADNVRFLARVYDRPEETLLAEVEEFAELGAYMHQPINTYSAGMVARLAFGASLNIRFECYLVDEVTAAGDMRFRKKSEDGLMARRKESTLIMISHDAGTLRQYCERGAVLYAGTLSFFDSIEEACEIHHGLQALSN